MYRIYRLSKLLSLAGMMRANTFNVAIATLSIFFPGLLSIFPICIGSSRFSSSFHLLSNLPMQVSSFRNSSIILFLSELLSVSPT